MKETEHFEAELKEFEENTWAIYTKNNDQLFAKYKIGEGIYFCNPHYMVTVAELNEILELINQLPS